MSSVATLRRTVQPPAASDGSHSEVRWRDRLLRWLVAAMLGAGFVVMFEPAPCDLLFVAAFVVAIACGQRPVPAGIGFAILASLYAFLFANLVSMLFVVDLGDGVRFLAITVYMVLLMALVAGFVAGRGRSAAELVTRMLVLAALAATVVAVLARLHLLPRSDLFFRDEHGLRVKSTFKDPNVFAPFLVAGFMFVLGRVVEEARLRWQRLWVLLFLAVGILLAFSRGAWMHLAVSLAVFVALHVSVLRQPRAVVRLVAVGTVLAVVGIPLLMAVLVQLDLAEFFGKRLGIKDYDTEERFATQALAIDQAVRWPLGIGPGQFTEARWPAASHSLYVRVLVENGVLGLIGVVGFLAAWIARVVAGIRARGPDAGLLVACLAVVAGALAESFVIDTLHWRHLFVVLGLALGLRLRGAADAPGVSGSAC